MNKQRHSTILRALAALDEPRTAIEKVLSDEQDAFDNLPEGIQASERGGAMGAAVEALEEAIQGFDEITASLKRAIEG